MNDTSLAEQVQKAEDQIVREALEAARWNVTQTALSLGISRTYLYVKLRRLGLVRRPRKGNGG